MSEATSPLTSLGLAALLKQSRRSNILTQVTGLLLHQPGTFMQLLEGDQDVVEALYAKIEIDSRHQQVTTVRTREQVGREFPDWNMAVGHTSQVVRLGGRDVDVFTGGAAPVTATDAEARFVRELLDLFDPQGEASRPGSGAGSASRRWGEGKAAATEARDHDRFFWGRPRRACDVSPFAAD